MNILLYYQLIYQDESNLFMSAPSLHRGSTDSLIREVTLWTTVLGIRMRIMCLTWSMWKVRNGEAWSAGKTMPCCPPPCSRVSKLNKSLEWWHASHFLSPLPCHLSSFCWAVNHLPYIWTHSGVARSSVLWVLDLDLHAIAWWHHERHVPKVYFNRKPVMDRHTNIQT